MSIMRTGLKILASSLVAMFVITGCGKETTDPVGGGGGSSFTISTDGTYTVPDASWIEGDSSGTNLEITFAGNMGTEVSGGDVFLPLNAASGTYTITTTSPYSTAMAAGTAYVEISGETTSYTAQSGTVTVVKNGNKYTIDFTNLPALSDETTPTSATLSAHIAM